MSSQSIGVAKSVLWIFDFEIDPRLAWTERIGDPSIPYPLLLFGIKQAFYSLSRASVTNLNKTRYPNQYISADGLV